MSWRQNTLFVFITPMEWVVWYFARIFIANGWLAFIHQTNRIQKAKFSTFFLERTLVNTIVRHSVQLYNSHCRQNSTQNQRKILHVFIGNFWNLTTFWHTCISCLSLSYVGKFIFQYIDTNANGQSTLRWLGFTDWWFITQNSIKLKVSFINYGYFYKRHQDQI